MKPARKRTFTVEVDVEGGETDDGEQLLRDLFRKAFGRQHHLSARAAITGARVTSVTDAGPAEMYDDEFFVALIVARR